MRLRLVVIATALTLLAPTAAAATTTPESPVPVAASDTPPPGRHLSSNQVLAIADALPKLQAVRKSHRGSFGDAYLKGPARWQVSYFSKQRQEIGQAIIADATGRVLEQWTGFQVAWAMARGYPGAFGRHVNALYVWLPLCALFFVPFLDWRKPLRLLHLDLLVLLSFSVSLAFFNHANIGMSTPLAYPPLAYLLARMLMLTRRPRAIPECGGREAGSPGAVVPDDGRPVAAGRQAPPLRLLVPWPWLAVGVVFLLGFRIGLNVVDSNVIDVGYAGVIGAQRIVHDRPLYGHYPADNEHGDTYGPVNYEAYVPFQQIFGWSGRWDDLPAAHAAAIAFDVLAILLLFLLGRQIRGPSLGVVLAYAWVSYPFTLYALESNSNDSLVAVLVLAALLAVSWRPRRGSAGAAGRGLAGESRRGLAREDGRGLAGAAGRGLAELSPKALTGALAALASLAKFAPLILVPVLATHRLYGLPRGRQAAALAAFSLAFLAAAALALVPALTHDSLHLILHRTLAYQTKRESPFSIWGFYGGLDYVQSALEGAVLALALGLAIVPRRADLVGLSAAAAALLVAVQLTVDHWFYLYIPWFFGAAMIALLGTLVVPAQPIPEAAAAASGPARSSPLATA